MVVWSVGDSELLEGGDEEERAEPDSIQGMII